MTTVPVFASSSVTITATYSGSKTATLTVTADVSFLMNRADEMIVASASGEPERVVPDEDPATADIVTAPPATTSQEKAPTFKLASLWTLGTNPFADLFRLRLGPDVESSGVSDSSEGGDGLLAGRFWNLGFGSAMAARASSGVRAPLVSTGSRYFFYTPEMNLMAETELTSNPTPLVLYEYIWFGGQPVAQVDSAGVTSWTFTDHLGTPLIQTSSAQGVTWRAEHEPYGQVFALRTLDQHQPLRLPGQEAEQLNLGPNGATERSYNIFRWYRNGWGRYTQPDPLMSRNTTLGELNLYSYVSNAPLTGQDPLGLFKIDGSCDCLAAAGGRPNNWQTTVRETSIWCQTKLGTITDPKVRKCITKYCQNGTIKCEKCGSHPTALGYTPLWDFYFGGGTAILCIDNSFSPGRPVGDRGDTVIHEWAHSCGWRHGGGGGIP